MKINLLLSDNSPRSGFVNIDPYAPSGDPLRTIGDVTNLDEHCEDAECDELVALDIIDYVPALELDSVLLHWLKKIRHGGSITLGGVDMREVSRAFVAQKISLEDANILFYGAQSAPWQYRKSTLTLQKLIELLESKGLKIVQKRINHFSYSVKAVRP